MREFFTGMHVSGTRVIGNNEDPTWKKQVNIENPMGYQGDLVKAFAELMGKLWMSDSMFSVWPWGFKRALGRINEDFQGRR
jgi:ubiquitin C-terminal hydrolase